MDYKELLKDNYVKWVFRALLTVILIIVCIDWYKGKNLKVFWGLLETHRTDSVYVVRHDTISVIKYDTVVIEPSKVARNASPTTVTSNNQKGGQTAGQINNNK